MTNEKANELDKAGATEWNVALTDEELGALSRGASPLLIRPEAIVSHVSATPMSRGKTHWEFVICKTSRGVTTHWEKRVTEERKPFFIDDFGNPWFLTEDGYAERYDFENKPAGSHTGTRRQEMTKLDPEVEKKIEKLEKEREILLETLLFYASWETYFAITVMGDPPCGPFIDDFSDVETEYGFNTWRPGRRAREAADKLGLELYYEYED